MDDSPRISDKYIYLNHPSLLEKFKANYLKSLNVYLNDDIFKEKTSTLPPVKSSTVMKFEKLIEKQQQELEKKRKLQDRRGISPVLQSKDNRSGGRIKSNSTSPLALAQYKGVSLRYIIMDTDTEVTLTNIEESLEFHSKLTDPFNAYFHESNDKLRKKALEQIANNIMPKEKKKTVGRINANGPKDKEALNSASSFHSHKDNPNLNLNANANTGQQIGQANAVETNSLVNNDLNVLMSKYNNSLMKNQASGDTKAHEAFQNFMKYFKECCEKNNIITLDQKIDYFALLKENRQLIKKDIHKRGTFIKPPTLSNHNERKRNMINKTENITLPIKEKDTITLNQSMININNPMNQTHTSNLEGTNTSYLNVSKSKGLNEMFYKYANDLKNKFKISEDQTLIKSWEGYYNDLSIKIGSSKILNKNMENSFNLFDKIKAMHNCTEITAERIILRKCEITADRLYYLLTKRCFDFRVLTHLNLSENNLFDMGGCYLLFLLDAFSTQLDYLNIGYNSLGRQSCDLLTHILQKNILKISTLHIGGNKLGDKLFSDICLGISKNSHLKKFYTNDNDLGKISSVILGTVLKYDKKLKVLDVSKNLITDEHIGNMMKGLICNTTLETLIINEMGLTNKALRVFETTLTINTTLKELFLERNRLNSNGWQVFSDIFNKNKFLEYLSLVGNHFDNEALDMIIDKQRQIKIKVISKTEYWQQIFSDNEAMNLYEYF